MFDARVTTQAQRRRPPGASIGTGAHQPGSPQRRLGVWAFGESLMDFPLNLSRPVARRLVGECPTILALVVAATENPECLLIERLAANLTTATNVDHATKWEGIPPTPSDTPKLIRAVAIQ